MISSSTVLAHVPMTVDTSSTGTTTISYQYNGHIYNTIYPYSSTGYNPYPTSVGSSTTYVSGLPHEMPTIYEMNFVEDEQEHKVKLAYSEPLKYKIGQWMKDNVSTPWSMHFSINPAPTGTHDSAMMTMTGQQIFSGKMSMVYSFADLATAALFRLKF
jgi:hypothetical protein